MKQTHSNTQSPVEKSAVLELHDVKKSFSVPGGDPLLILDVPFFQIAAGELVALEGQSGSGKSTLLNVVSGIMRPDSCLLYTSPSPRDGLLSRMPSSA